MKVYVCFDFPGIDADSEEADVICDCLEEDLYDFGCWGYVEEIIDDDEYNSF